MRACGSSGELRPQMWPGINNSMWSHLCSCVLTDSWRNLSVSLRFLQQGQEFIRCDKRKTEAGRQLHKSECPVLKISQIIPSSQHLAVNYCTWTRIWWGNKEFRQQLPAFCTELQNLLSFCKPKDGALVEGTQEAELTPGDGQGVSPDHFPSSVPAWPCCGRRDGPHRHFEAYHPEVPFG